MSDLGDPADDHHGAAGRAEQWIFCQGNCRSSTIGQRVPDRADCMIIHHHRTTAMRAHAAWSAVTVAVL